MAKLINSTNIKQVDGGQVIKSGDFGSNFKFNLLDENNNPIVDINGTKAIVVLFSNETQEIFYKRESTVEDGAVEFKILEKLPAGKYYLEIHAGGYIFPSNNKFKIVVNHSSKFERGNQKGGVDKLVNDLLDNVDSNSNLPQIVKQYLKYGVANLNLNYDKYWELVNRYNNAELGKIKHINDYNIYIYPFIQYLVNTHHQDDLNSTADDLIGQLNSIPKFERKLIAESNSVTEFKLDKKYSNIVVECICEFASNDEIDAYNPPRIFVDFNREERSAYIIPNMKFKVVFFANDDEGEDREIADRIMDNLDKISINYKRSNIEGTVKFSNVKVYGL